MGPSRNMQISFLRKLAKYAFELGEKRTIQNYLTDAEKIYLSIKGAATKVEALIHLAYTAEMLGDRKVAQNYLLKGDKIAINSGFDPEVYIPPLFKLISASGNLAVNYLDQNYLELGQRLILYIEEPRLRSEALSMLAKDAGKMAYISTDSNYIDLGVQIANSIDIASFQYSPFSNLYQGSFSELELGINGSYLRASAFIYLTKVACELNLWQKAYSLSDIPPNSLYISFLQLDHKISFRKTK